MTKKLLKLNLLALLFAVFACSNYASAQTTVQIGGSGTATSFYSPIYTCYTYNYSQQIYLGSELTTAGASGPSYISKIRFWYAVPGYDLIYGTWNQWTIYMGNTPLNSFANINSWVPTTSMTQVYSGTIGTVLPAAGTWLEVTLTTPIYWDGVSNLVVAVDENSASYDCTVEWGSYTATAASGTRSLLFYDDPTNPNPAAPPMATYSSNDIARVQFVVAPAPACTTPPTPGTATVSNATPCLNGNITFSLSGNTIGTGISIQWESAPSAAGPWTPTGPATGSAYYTTTAPASMFYRAAVTCGASTTYSNVVATTVPPLFPGGTYTIDATQPASATNFQSFATAAAAINCGITSNIIFNVNPLGSYANDRFLLDDLNSTSGFSITVNGNSATLSFVSTNPSDMAGIRLDGTDHVTINNLNITATGTTTSQYGYGVHLTNNADFNTISNCTITVDAASTSTNYIPVVVSGSLFSPTMAGSNCDNNTFTGNTLNGGYYSIVLYGNASAPYITNNTITNNIIRNSYSYSIYLYGNDIALVEGNDISRPTRTNSTTYAGVIFSGPTRNVVFTRNRIHNTSDAMLTSTSTVYGIFSSAADGVAGSENIISNNLVYNINGAGIIYGIYNTGSDQYRYYHNTISLDNTSSTTTAVTRGVYQTTAATGLQFQNNIFTVTRGGTGIKYGIYLNTATTTWTANRNDYFVGGSGTNYVGYAAATSYSSLSSWQTATSQDANSFAEPPLYANVGTGDFTPGNSQIDNAGAFVGVTTDILNNARSAGTPDIGAYEFTVPACSGTPTAGTATVNNATTTSVCMGSPLNLVLQGVSSGAGIGYQWQSSTVGANNWTPIGGATGIVYNTTLTGALDFRAAVTCLGNTVYSNVVTANKNPVYVCYCSPNTGVTLHGTTTNYTTNVAIPTTTLNSPSAAVGTGGYTYKDPSITSNTATLNMNTPYTLTITQSSTSTSIRSEVWVDWNQNGLFDATEYYTTVRSGSLSTGTITPPVTALPGMTGLRVRTIFSTTVTYGASGACSNVSTGRETEDYVITVAYPLDIKMSKITASNVGSRNRVDWSTESEEKGDRFEIERSVDGIHFSYLGKAEAKGFASAYTYWDENPVTGTNYYRLKMIDASGSSSFSSIVSAHVKSGTFTIEAFPNPVTDILTLKVYGVASANAMVNITDVTGKVVSTLPVNGNEARIDMKGMAQGIYLLKYSDNNNSQTIRVNKK